MQQKLFILVIIITKTQQVINKFSSKRVQDHATYLPVNMVCDWCRASALNMVRDWSISFALNISHLETNKYKEGNKNFCARAGAGLIPWSWRVSVLHRENDQV